MRVAAWAITAAGCGPGTGPADPTTPPGDPGIQIGQSGTDCSGELVPLDDVSRPLGGLSFSGAAWVEAVPPRLSGTITAGDRDEPVVVTVEAGEPMEWVSDCEPAYGAATRVRIDGGAFIAVDLAVTLVSTGPSGARWREDVPAAEGTFDRPDLDGVGFVSIGWLEGAVGHGTLDWEATADSGTVRIPVAEWLASAD